MPVQREWSIECVMYEYVSNSCRDEMVASEVINAKDLAKSKATLVYGQMDESPVLWLELRSQY